MKYLFSAAAAAFVLSACNGAPPNEEILTELCTDLFEGDTRSVTMIAEDTGTDLATFCGCFAAQTVADGTKVDLYKDILVQMTELRSADDADVDDTADRIEDKLESGEIDSFNENDFESLGDYFQDLAINMGGTNGTCPAG